MTPCRLRLYAPWRTAPALLLWAHILARCMNDSQLPSCMLLLGLLYTPLQTKLLHRSALDHCKAVLLSKTLSSSGGGVFLRVGILGSLPLAANAEASANGGRRLQPCVCPGCSTASGPSRQVLSRHLTGCCKTCQRDARPAHEEGVRSPGCACEGLWPVAAALCGPAALQAAA